MPLHIPDLSYWLVDTTLLVFGIVIADLIHDWIRGKVGKK